ncbi:MAG: hypothetical protein KF718_02455 [Polyangiaceae bacterium]|nr:hypothetical protein [Polyangiaceae bacterium]
MLVVVPHLRGRHRRLVEARLHGLERLIVEAQFVKGIEVLIVIEEQLDHVSVGVLAGADAIVEVMRAGSWAASFMLARPWVPVLVVDRSGGGAVALGCTTPQVRTSRSR